MNEIPARCDSCGCLSRVPALAVGKSAVCPLCRAEFVVRDLALQAKPSLKEIPVVYPVHVRTEPASGVLYGLAISAFLVPLAWLMTKALGFKPPVFTLGLPLAIALAAAGLSFGVAMVKDWSFGFRIKAILILLGLAWGLGATFYFLKAEWVEAVRRDLGLPGGPWHEFKPPEGPYKIQMPGHPRKADVELVQGWDIEAFRLADKDGASFVFAVGHGKPVAANQDAFFAAAKAGATAAANGTLIDEKVLLPLQGAPGREYVFKIGVTNRTVRVYRLGTKAIVAMAEGAFLPTDAREVKHFFNSLYLQTGR